jgi:alpha-L-rhamnosidase
MCPPIKVGRVIKTVGVKEIKPGVHLFDLGENFAGVIRLRVSGKAGDTVVMRYGELLNDDGTLNPMTSCAGQIKNGRNGSPGVPETAWQSDTYILRGGEAEEYVPRFTFHGFRYVEVTGLPGAPTTDTILGLAQHASVDSAGVFTCANDMFNKVQEVTRRTLLSNLFSVQSDCPHREKFGYGGDIVASSGMAMFNFDMTQFYIKSVRDLQDAVRPNGGFTETAPYVSISDAGLGEKSGPIGWGTAHPLLLWQLYKFTGNTRLIEEQYPYVQRWIELLNSKAQDGLLDNGIGDHETIADKSTLVSGTVFYHLNLTLAARLADILGKIDDVTRYSAQAQAVREALNTRVLKDGLYAIGTQACQAMPLYTGMVPEEVRESVLQGLVRDIESHDNHLTTGIFGTPAMLFALTNNGRADVAYRIADQRTFPGWGHMLERGATTLWEHWEFSDNTFSHNHPMFGSISEWFFRSLAGINEASDAKGFDRIEFRPNPVSGLASAEAQYESVRGKVECRWIVENGRFKVGVRIPAGATAKLFLPIAEGVEEGGKPFAVAKTPSGSIAALESGIYLFSMPVK